MTCVVGCSRFSVCMRLTSLLVPMPTLMMSSNNPVHRNLKSAVQIVAMSPSAPSAARILAVMVLVSYGVLDCCVYVAGPVHDVCSDCSSIGDAGGAVLAPYAVVYGVVVFE